MDLVCVGDVMLDVHVTAGALARGGDVHGSVRIQPGGTSANAAIWAAWSGATASVVGAVGDDLAGRLVTEALRRRGVDTGGVVVREAPTGTMLVVTEAGERSMVADRGANALLGPGDLPSLAAGAVLVSGYLLLQEPGNATARAALAAAQAPMVGVDAASWPLVEDFGKKRFLSETAEATALLANEREATALTGLEGPDAGRALAERYRIVAVKGGDRGATLVIDGDVIEADAEAIAEIDPTGAGDAFDGVLLASLARGTRPAEALERACHAGALVAGSAQTWPGEATT